MDGFGLKKARGLWNFCGKSSRLADFENTVDRGSAVIFDAGSGLCLSYVRILGPKRNIWIIDFSSALVGMLLSSSKLFLFSKKVHLNSVRDCYWNCIVL